MDTLLSSYCLTSGCDSLFFRDYNILVLLRSRPPAFPCALHAPVLPGKPTSSKHSCKELSIGRGRVFAYTTVYTSDLSCSNACRRFSARARPYGTPSVFFKFITDALGRPENLGLGLGLGLLGRPESAATGLGST